MLISTKANANANVKDGWSALHAAISGNHAVVAEILTKVGADINTQNISEATPCYTIQPEIIDILKTVGAKQ